MYTYHKATENGMTLHIIETDASNIRPVQLLKTSNLKGSNEYGINGGWLRGMDLNHRPPGYELLPAVQSFDFKCFPTLFVPENCQIPEVVCCLLRWDFSRSGSSHGSK